MKLHFSRFSSNSQRVLAVAHELGISLELCDVDLATGAHKSPEFLALNPNGRVPVLEDGDFVLFESTAIINYLADQVDGHPLHPSSARARAEILQWQSWTLHHFVRASDVLLFEHVIKGFFDLGSPDGAAIERANEALRPLLEVLEARLSRGEFLVGTGCTLADHHLYAIFNIRDAIQLPSLTPYPAIARWVTRMSSLPGWKHLQP